MGVDYVGYSCVRREPVPAEYRPVLREWTREERDAFALRYEAAPRDIRPLITTMEGVSIDIDNQFVFPVKYECKSDTSALEESDGVLAVYYDKNIVYHNTSETVKGTTAYSYHGYGEFVRVVRHLNRSASFYMPPSTDTAPESGHLSADDCARCLKTLNAVRSHFVSDAWTASSNATETVSSDDDRDSHHSWFFREFYYIMQLGANSGFVQIQ